MNQRCYNKNLKIYKYYGGRGIKVCEKWRRKKRKDAESFINFVKDMGEKPEGYSLERINVDEDYCPKNCTWATKSEQVKNRRKYKNPKIAGDKNHNIKLSKDDIKEIKQKLETPYHGIISKLAREYGVNRCSIYRIKKGEMYYST